MQIHDDIAFNRVEAFIKGEDNETLVGTETAKPKRTRKLAAPRRALENDVTASVSAGAGRPASSVGH